MEFMLDYEKLVVNHIALFEITDLFQKALLFEVGSQQTLKQ